MVFQECTVNPDLKLHVLNLRPTRRKMVGSQTTNQPVMGTTAAAQHPRQGIELEADKNQFVAMKMEQLGVHPQHLLTTMISTIPIHMTLTILRLLVTTRWKHYPTWTTTETCYLRLGTSVKDPRCWNFMNWKRWVYSESVSGLIQYVIATILLDVLVNSSSYLKQRPEWENALIHGIGRGQMPPSSVHEEGDTLLTVNKPDAKPTWRPEWVGHDEA